MITLVLAIIIVGSVAIVVYPFFKPALELDVTFFDLKEPGREGLISQRDSAYSAIKDLEFDHVMGKLSTADYRSLRGKYEAKAVAVLQELDRLGSVQVADERTTRGGDAIEREVERLRRAASGSLTCPKCATSHLAGDAFCAKCGASLKGVRCPSCGKRASLNDKFCSKCGTPIRG